MFPKTKIEPSEKYFGIFFFLKIEIIEDKNNKCQRRNSSEIRVSILLSKYVDMSKAKLEKENLSVMICTVL